MNKHTPGPWYIEEPNLKKQRVDISTDEACPTTGAASWRGLARVYGCIDWPKSGAQAMMANARLIAAAPELLEALLVAKEVIHYVLLEEGHYASDEKVALIDAAIAKATGEPQ